MVVYPHYFVSHSLEVYTVYNMYLKPKVKEKFNYVVNIEVK